MSAIPRRKKWHGIRVQGAGLYPGKGKGHEVLQRDLQCRGSCTRSTSTECLYTAMSRIGNSVARISAAPRSQTG